ncbi:acyl-CoA dehydrogenase family protein [Streptacidiphilus sp. P02-A3a]|uniref:acyl-CoA dehydrogenase family protein n=1 Tax=Streptacidiphilus sp. P02-A3a TaxID=2704468 RepID=UPI0015FE0623|nr:acyl-CoA dehydrogenase family protein [Streptacidiphilus sp. P02-A3a]QMU67391.1 acyl-CoA dehydrogenase family protein [Streptacidiphilus sp. P02-A3a]
MTDNQNSDLAREFLGSPASASVLGALVPREYGGLDLSHADYGEINRVVAEQSPSRQSLLTVHGMVCRTVARWGSLPLRQEYLPRLADGGMLGAFALSEDVAGSDVRRITTTAREVPGGWVLDGRKRWITFGQEAGVFLVFARAPKHDLALLVRRDNPGAYLQPAPRTSGFGDARLAELVLRDCRVDADQLLGRPGAALTHIVSDALTLGRLCVAFGAWGLAGAALSAALQRSIERHQFDGPLHRLQLVRGMLADAAVAVDSAELLCRQAALALDGRDEWALGRILTAKLAASRAATTAAAVAAQLHGAAGLVEGCAVDRYVRDARVYEVIEGNTQLLQDLIADQALARHRDRAARASAPSALILTGGHHAT